MSLINANEIRDLTSSTTIAPSIPALEPRLATVWGTFFGTNAALFETMGVSSISDNGIGNYNVSVINQFSSSTYPVVYGYDGTSTVVHATTTKFPATFRINARNSSSGSLQDANTSFAVFGGN